MRSTSRGLGFDIHVYALFQVPTLSELRHEWQCSSFGDYQEADVRAAAWVLG